MIRRHLVAVNKNVISNDREKSIHPQGTMYSFLTIVRNDLTKSTLQQERLSLLWQTLSFGKQFKQTFFDMLIPAFFAVIVTFTFRCQANVCHINFHRVVFFQNLEN